MTAGQDNTLPLVDFDRDLTLDELLAGIDLDKLRLPLSNLLTPAYRLVAPDGRIILGEIDLEVARRQPLRLEIDTVAYLEVGSDDHVSLQAAAVLLELFFTSSARYLMATNLHLQAVRDDYEKLQRQHAALLESEARYRGLSKNLEQRVMEQVQTIDSTRRQLYQAEKMASVGQLAAGVAHEINNPIGFIVSNLGAARSYISQISAFMDTYRRGPGTVALDAAWKSNDLDYVLDDFQTLIKESSAGAARVAKIVKDLKDFSNVDRSDEEFIDINDCLRSVCNIAQSELSRTAEVGLKLSCLPLTRCYPAHLSQAFLNILLNAGQAVNSDGRVMISTTYLPADEHGADADESNGEICICISDNGGGIHQSIIDRVFDPFFTSREVGQGTGLGLTVCRDIVHAHDGRINIDSRVGEGSVVTIYLPVKAK